MHASQDYKIGAIMKKKLKRLFPFLIIFFVFSYVQSVTKINPGIYDDLNVRMINDTIPTDTLTKKDSISIKAKTIIYFLDKKPVSEELIHKMAEKRYVGNGKGYSDPRTAIRFYGEKARYGIFFYESKQKEL